MLFIDNNAHDVLLYLCLYWMGFYRIVDKALEVPTSWNLPELNALHLIYMRQIGIVNHLSILLHL